MFEATKMGIWQDLGLVLSASHWPRRSFWRQIGSEQLGMSERMGRDHI